MWDYVGLALLVLVVQVAVALVMGPVLGRRFAGQHRAAPVDVAGLQREARASAARGRRRKRAAVTALVLLLVALVAVPARADEALTLTPAVQEPGQRRPVRVHNGTSDALTVTVQATALAQTPDGALLFPRDADVRLHGPRTLRLAPGQARTVHVTSEQPAALRALVTVSDDVRAGVTSLLRTAAPLRVVAQPGAVPRDGDARPAVAPEQFVPAARDVPLAALMALVLLAAALVYQARRNRIAKEEEEQL